MGIKKNLSYNKKLDIIEGYQDQGNQGRTNEVANKALVFILSGIRKKWKQPIAYYLSGNYTTADRLATLIKEVLEECFKVGLNIIATMCDLSQLILGGGNHSPLDCDTTTPKYISSSDSQLSKSRETQKSLYCTIEQMCSTVGQLSGQLKELMCRMMEAFEKNRCN
ncbi:unnamed protein product [Parnassius apollo]|uniref:(apollo) hypothetical protein n=1 Tax=Parnassius apollo TaxID=110799 RepID=A0A8S3VZ42_PARAO|nr:unnamed protein product [Parnassius apollo]